MLFFHKFTFAQENAFSQHNVFCPKRKTPLLKSWNVFPKSCAF